MSDARQLPHQQPEVEPAVRRERDAALAFDQIRHPPRRPETRAVSQRFGPPLVGVLDPAQIVRGQLGLTTGAARSLQRLTSERSVF